jgi:hypothetical protein
MPGVPSLHEMIEGLKRTVAFHKDREAFHGKQEAHHAQHQKLHLEERTRHSAELEAASRQLEELQSMAERLGQVVTQSRAIAPPETDQQVLGVHPNVSKAVDQVLASWPQDVPFTATTLAAEVSRRYAAVLRRGVSPRVVASALRRRRDDRMVEELREGRPFLEALYRKRT